MFFELFTSLMQTAGPLGGLFDFMNPAFSCENCTGSSFTAIAAAMATQGYWAQADIVEFLQFSSFKDLAILFYVCSAAGGLISMALGMPPKLYLWFFMGPPLYQFLLIEPAHTNGSRWEVAKQVQNQSDVWKLAYTGIQNTRAFQDTGISLKSFQNPFTGENIYLEPSGGGAKVSWFFAYFDIIVSSVVQNLISWFGPYSAVPGSSGGLRLGNGDGSWHLLTDQKWGMLETITAARITDAALRDVLVTFLSSECGDRFRSSVNLGNLTQANSAKGRNLPRGAPNDTTVFWSTAEVTRVTDNFSIPTPSTLGSLFRDGSKSINALGAPGSFLKATGLGGTLGGSSDVLSRFGAAQMATCSQLLYSIMVGVRWEAGHTYARLMTQAPAVVPSGDGFLAGLSSSAMQMTPGMVTSILFYGWEIPGSTGSFNFNLGGLGDASMIPNPQRDEAQQQFLLNLITTHIIKNELAIAPPVMTQRGADSRESENFSVIYASTVGSKSKFGELYVWALMMPYLQGIFLYFLAIAYPFVTMAMVVPGWHKMFFSWMTFWVWVKLWDVGFAIVAMAERSIWAMLGNSSDAAAVFQRVNEMSNFGKVEVKCVAGSILGGAGGAGTSVPCQGNQVVDVLVKGQSGLMSLGESIRMLDLAMLLGASMDLDRANAFYIYFMAALKFAVPVVVGQLVLGSKAAVAGMVKDFTGASQDAGRAAGSAFTAQKTAAAGANAASQAQAASMKAMRQQGMVAQALGVGNRALMVGAQGAAAQQESQGMGAMSQALSAGEKQQGAALRYRVAGLRAAFAASGLAQIYNGVKDNKNLSESGGVSGVGSSISQIGRGAEQAERAIQNGQSRTGALAPGSAQSGQPGGSNQSGRSAAGSGGGIAPAFGGSSSGRQVSASSGGGSVAAFGGSSSGQQGSAAAGFAGSTPSAGAVEGRGAWLQWLYGGQSLIGVGENAYSTFLHGRNMVLDGTQGTGDAQIAMGFAGASAKIGALQSEYGISGFGYSQQSQGMNLNQQRLQSGADFGAQQAAWLDRANYANAASGTLAAMGVSPGTISAGQKPDNAVGASWVGQLGTGAQQAAQYASDGGAFNQWLNQTQGKLFASYGYDSIMAQYQTATRTPSQAWAEAAAPYEAWDMATGHMDQQPFNMMPMNTAKLTSPITGRIEHHERTKR